MYVLAKRRGRPKKNRAPSATVAATEDEDVAATADDAIAATTDNDADASPDQDVAGHVAKKRTVNHSTSELQSRELLI